MSTRAIITAKDASGSFDVRRLYLHGDGYPSGVGILLSNFLKVLPSLGQFGSRKVHRAAWGDWKKGLEGRYQRFSGRGRAYATMHNVAAEPDQFIPALSSYLMSKGYGSVYLTDRDPVKEAKEDWTDIEWHYVVTLKLDGKPKLEVYEYDYDKKGFKRRSRSVEELAEAEQREWRRRQEEYEQEQKSKKKSATKKSPKPSSRLQGMQ